MKNHGISPQEAAAALGSIRTAKKAAASAANGRKNTAKALPECTCKRCPDTYSLEAKAGAADCKRAKTIRQRQWRERKRLNTASPYPPAQPEGD